MPTYRAGAGRVRARRGGAALGRRGQGVPRLLRRALGPQRRPLPPADRRRDPRAGGAAGATSRTSSTPSRRCGSPSGSPSRASAARVFLCNSGTEANECAIKLARKHAHGRGIDEPGDRRPRGRLPRPHLGALAATPKLAREDLLRAAAAPASSPCPATTPEALRAAVGERTAAVLIEPIQGEAGVYPIADEVLLAAREACDAAGALLIFDEIQTGMGRTGSLWAYEQLPVRPDVMTTAKALGGGLPVGACVDHARARRRARAAATTARPSPAARSPPRRRSPPST